MSSNTDTVDGRHARSNRSRDKAIRAMLTLIRRTREVPTADAVAELAGLSRRTVFRQFRDLESLHVAANAHMEAEVIRRFPPPMPAGECCEETITRVVDHRVAVFEHILPLRQTADRLRHQHTFVAQSLDQSDAQLRMHTRIMFMNHLAEHDTERWASVELMTSWYTYRTLRGPQCQTAEHAKAIILANLRRILTNDADGTARAIKTV